MTIVLQKYGLLDITVDKSVFSQLVVVSSNPGKVN